MTDMKEFLFFAGSDNGSEKGGLRSFAMNRENGAIRELARVENARSPIYLALSADSRFLYVAQRTDGDGPPGCVAAYAVGRNRPGEPFFRKINECPCAPSVPCHISVSKNPAGTFLFFAEYGCGTAGVLRIRDDGGLEGPLHMVTHSGKLGPDKERQDRPHCHHITQAADGAVFVCDLGMDSVVGYDFNLEIPTGWKAYRTLPGAGPRHMIFDDAGKRAYLLNELDSTLSVLDYKCGGILEEVQTLPMLPEGFAGFSKAAAVKISPDKKWVLASNRGHDSIAAFRICEGGRLAPPVINKLGGRFPRDFEFAPGGEFVVVGHKLSNEIAVYKFDCENGILTQTEHVFAMTKPLCFVFGG